MRSRQISRLLPLLIRRSNSRETSPGSMSVPGRKTGPVSASRASRSAIGMRRAMAIASRVSIVGLPFPASSCDRVALLSPARRAISAALIPRC